jgi:hypothetical protein
VETAWHGSRIDCCEELGQWVGKLVYIEPAEYPGGEFCLLGPGSGIARIADGVCFPVPAVELLAIHRQQFAFGWQFAEDR